MTETKSTKMHPSEFIKKNFPQYQGKGFEYGQAFLARLKEINPPCNGRAEVRLTEDNAVEILRDYVEFAVGVVGFLTPDDAEQGLALVDALHLAAQGAIKDHLTMSAAKAEAQAKGEVMTDEEVLAADRAEGGDVADTLRKLAREMGIDLSDLH